MIEHERSAAMHPFQQRLEQLLASVDGLSDGRRQRLARPLRQADIRCWETPPKETPQDESIDAALLACTRTLAHELLDGLALHLEAALAACSTWETRLLVAAVAARETILGRQVWFQVDGKRLGCAFPTNVRLTLTPQQPSQTAGLHIEVEETPTVRSRPARRLQLQIVCNDRPEPRPADLLAAAEKICFAPPDVRRNPFLAAARIGRAIAVGLGEDVVSHNE